MGGVSRKSKGPRKQTKAAALTGKVGPGPPGWGSRCLGKGNWLTGQGRLISVKEIQAAAALG